MTERMTLDEARAIVADAKRKGDTLRRTSPLVASLAATYTVDEIREGLDVAATIYDLEGDDALAVLDKVARQRFKLGNDLAIGAHSASEPNMRAAQVLSAIHEHLTSI
jgi:cob(I)alamin adenosyltransferase